MSALPADLSPLRGDEPELRAAMRSWLEERMTELRGAAGATQTLDETADIELRRSFAAMLARDGWACLSWDPVYGGRGASIRAKLTFAEEMVRIDAPDPLSRIGMETLGPAIIEHGTEKQRERFLPRIRSAEDIWCQGFSEPAAGSDLASLRTRARRAADGSWRISGQKVWTTIAQHADFCFVLARTDPEAPPHRGISAFAVPMNLPGVTVRPIEQITGSHEFSEVFFDDVVIPEDNLIGSPGDGWAIAISALGFERSTNFMARQLRLARLVDGLIDRTRAHAERLPASLLERLAEIYVASAALRATVYHHVESLERSERPGPDNSASKIYWSETFQELADLGAEVDLLLGAPSEWSALYLEARASTIYAGTSEIQRNIIAERGLGLPR